MDRKKQYILRMYRGTTIFRSLEEADDFLDKHKAIKEHPATHLFVEYFEPHFTVELGLNRKIQLR